MRGTCLLHSNAQTRLVREQLSSADSDSEYHRGHLRNILAKTQRSEVGHTSLEVVRVGVENIDSSPPAHELDHYVPLSLSFLMCKTGTMEILASQNWCQD